MTQALKAENTPRRARGGTRGPTRGASGGALLAAAATLAGGYWAGFGARSQQFGSFPYKGDTELPLVALTFDDGPNEPYTSRLLDTLAERSVPGTFFQVGRCAERFPSATRRVVEEGHVLGNHSYRHSFTSYLRKPKQTDEIARAQDALTSISGVDSSPVSAAVAVPLAMGAVHSVSRRRAAGGVGRLRSSARGVPTARRVDGALGERVGGPGAILIFHDGYESYGGRRDQSVAAIGPLIDLLRDRGFGFTTVDQLLGVPAYQS